jgi:hypothetical protein
MANAWSRIVGIDVLLSFNVAAIMEHSCFRFRLLQQNEYAPINRIDVPNILYIFVLPLYIGAANHLTKI